ALRGGVRHVMELLLLRACGTVQQNPHMRALVSGADSTVEQKEKYRLALGMLLERFGPVNVQCGVMSFEAFWVALVAAITAPRNYVHAAHDLLLHRLRWRHVRDQSVLVLADVCPERVAGKTQRSMWDYVEVLRDFRVVVMIFQYSACLSTELAKSKHLVNAPVGVARSLSVVTATADADSTNVEAGLRTAIAGFGMLVCICWDKAFETVAEDTAMASTTTSGWMVS
ncbi:unnamed protein product, partial [Symbiodinium necroappetens]